MELTKTPLAGKILYGGMFTVVLPVVLWAWTANLSTSLPTVHQPAMGRVLAVIGLLLMVAGMVRLRREGGGLPMNAYPPPQVARGGVFALVPHPIYMGFVLACAGLSMATGSVAGLWITTPLVALGCLALVLGYEGPDLRRRFGDALPSPWLSIPRAGDEEISMARRAGTTMFVCFLWGIAYAAVKALDVPQGAIETRLAWEWSIPLLPASMAIYASIYFVVPAAFLRCRRAADLRRLAIAGLAATAVNTLAYLVVPATAAFRVVEPIGWNARWMMWEQGLASPAAGSFPSFHATWAVLAAVALARGRGRIARGFWTTWCLGLAASCLTTGMHSVLDVAAGALVGWWLRDPATPWNALLRATERLGDSWGAWRVGPLRVISHSVWAGLAGFLGIAVVGAAAGGDGLGWALAVAAGSLVGAGLWAQWVEGSSALLRPFGYYGSILGGLVALIVVRLAGGPAEVLLGAFAVAAPFIQAIGRMRCIVQGCCHGRPVDWGVRVTNPHSRVVKLAALAGVPIHPTPLYSILANLALGLLLGRIWLAGGGALTLAGAYFAIAGMARFAEEAYRGEPQTERFAGLALYQWMSLASLLLGMALLAAPPQAMPSVQIPSTGAWGGALAWGLASAFAMGMDFPGSSRRFSRLTG